MEFPPPVSRSEPTLSRSGYRPGSPQPGFILPPPQNPNTTSIEEVAEEAYTEFKNIRDGQLDLNDRLDLMEQISGYGVAYMRENRYKNRRTWNLMEFNGQLGPLKNASLENNGLVLAEGTWVINSQVTHDQHVDRLSSRIRVEVQLPDGTPYSRKEHYGEVLPNKWATQTVPHTVVTPGPGYRVQVFTWYDVGTAFGVYNRLLYRGGTHLTHLSAHRLNIDTSNAIVEETVPTVGSEQGSD